MEWKKHDTDYNYAWGLWTSSHQALLLMFQMFLFLHLVTMLALWSEWLEGLKIMAVNFCLVLSLIFYYCSTHNLLGKRLFIPMTIWFLAGLGIAYTLKPIQKLINPDK